jgi:hypothetical protein
MLIIAAFLLTIPAANWMISHVVDCSSGGPCTIPVGFGFQAPSGVILIGLALALRDAVHERYNSRVVFLAILAARPFRCSSHRLPWRLPPAPRFCFRNRPTCSFIAPLRHQNRPLAVLASGVVGSIVDQRRLPLSGLRFARLSHRSGARQTWMTLAAAVVASFLPLRRATE